MFERETRREKILEARNKELRLKEKTKGILNLGGGGGLMSGIGSGSGNAGGGEKSEEGKDGKEAGPNKFEKAALVAVSTPSIGVQDKKDEKRVKELVKTDGEKTGEDGEKGESKDEKKVGSKVQCRFCFENCTQEGRRGEKGGIANFKKQHTEPLTRINSTPVYRNRVLPNIY